MSASGFQRHHIPLDLGYQILVSLTLSPTLVLRVELSPLKEQNYSLNCTVMSIDPALENLLLVCSFCCKCTMSKTILSNEGSLIKS